MKRWSVYWEPGDQIWLAEPNGPCEKSCPCDGFITWAEAMAYVDRFFREA